MTTLPPDEIIIGNQLYIRVELVDERFKELFGKVMSRMDALQAKVGGMS